MRSDLPPAFAPVFLERTDWVCAEAVRRAEAGADEGLLVVAAAQENAPGLDHARAARGPGNLYCAVLLRPDYPRAEAAQLALVATVAAGSALASLLEPMTGLRYAWPTRLLINALPAGTVYPLLGPGDPPAWAVLGFTVLVEEAPADPDFPATNSVRASGTPGVGTAEVLAALARQFLSWADRWATDGFAPIGKAWLQRADGIGERCRLEAGGEAIEGQVLGLDEDGRLRVETGTGERRIGPLACFPPGPPR